MAEPDAKRSRAGHSASRGLASTRSTIALWFGVLGGPLAMLANLQTEYALVHWSCVHGARFALHIPPVVFIGVTVAAAMSAYHEWRNAGAQEPDGESVVRGRVKFVGALGLATSTLFALIIGTMWLADAFLGPCDRS